MALKGGFTTGWRLGGAAEGLAMSAIILAVVAALTYAATRPAARIRWDLTSGADYSLSDQTRSILDELEFPVNFVSIMRPEIPPWPTQLDQVQREAGDYVNTLLEQYVLASDGKVSVAVLDPHRDRLKVERITRELGLGRYNVVLAEGPNRVVRIHLEEMVTIDQGLADPSQIQLATLIELHAEGPLTSALLTVASEQAPTLGFLSGYGGPRLDGDDIVDLGRLRNALRGQGFEVAGVDLSQPDVTLDEDVIVVLGPLRPVGSDVTEALRGVLERGGSLFFALDPEYESTALDELLVDVGIAREGVILCRRDSRAEGPSRSVLTLHRFNDEHPITASISKQGTFARMIGVDGLARATGTPAERATHPLVTTPAEVFGDHMGSKGQGNWVLDPDEQGGARHVAFAVELETGGRVVVFGNSVFLTNGFLASTDGGPANMDLALGAMNWLIDREEAIDVRPKQVFESRVDLIEGESLQVRLYVLLFMPLGGALLGLLVWFSRRR